MVVIDYSFTDADVRADQSLVWAADEYIAKYTGDFQPLLELKSFQAAGGELAVPMVRKVLNCMRHDPNVYFAPRPESEPIVVKFTPRNQSKRLPKPKPRNRIRLRVTWKRPYGYSTATDRARRIHVLDQAQSWIDYTPWNDALDPHLRWLCGRMAQYTRYETDDYSKRLWAVYKIQLINAEERGHLLNQEGWRVCPQCISAGERRGHAT